MGVVKYNIYPTPHVSEGTWQDFVIRVHKSSASVDSTSPPDMVKTHWTGIIDAAKDSQTALDNYVSNNMSSTWQTWYNNKTSTVQGHIRTALAEL